MNQDTLDEVFCEGRNVEEALQAACDKLNTTPNQVDHEVVREGSNGGVLGFLRGRTTRIRVWKKSQTQVRLVELLKQFFSHLGFVSDFKVTRAEDAYEVAIDTEGADGLLIGRGGETLAALQHLIARMAARIDEDVRVRVDVAGYRARRQEQLRVKALELAEKSHSSGKEVMTEPLPADERRIVHLALSEDSRVETHAIGDGLTKRIIVSPTGSGVRRAPAAGRESSRDATSEPGRPMERGRGRGAEGHSRGGRGANREGGARDSDSRHGGRSPRGQSRVSGERPVSGREPGAEAPPPRRTRERAPESRPAPERVPESRPAPERTPESRPVPERTPESRPAPERAPESRPAPERAPESRPAPPAAPESAPTPRKEESYFQIPESIGLISSPSTSREAESPSEESGDAAGQARTFGRRPKPGRGRRR